MTIMNYFYMSSTKLKLLSWRKCLKHLNSIGITKKDISHSALIELWKLVTAVIIAIFICRNVVPDSAILCKGEPREAKDIVNEIEIGASVKHNFIVSVL